MEFSPNQIRNGSKETKKKQKISNSSNNNNEKWELNENEKKKLIEKVGQTSWENGCYAGLVHESWYHQYHSELGLNPIFRVKHNNYTHIQQWSTMRELSGHNCSPTCYSSALMLLLFPFFFVVHFEVYTEARKKKKKRNLFHKICVCAHSVGRCFFFSAKFGNSDQMSEHKVTAENFSLKWCLKVKSWTLKRFNSNARMFHPYYLYTMKRKFMTVSFATISFV